jgi:hypothetical protein
MNEFQIVALASTANCEYIPNYALDITAEEKRDSAALYKRAGAPG